MTKKIRWGILSTASIGKKRLIPAINQSSNGEVVAVASRNLERAQRFADENAIPQAYSTYEELINAPDIDAIYNPLPNSEHAEWSIKCAAAGKPVLCEKPLASDAAEAQTMVDAFAERELLFAEAFMYRFHPQTQRVKQLLEEDAIGRLQVISAAFTFMVTDEENIRLNKTLAGGSLMDVGAYCLNVMRFMTGEEPKSGQAIAHIGEESQVDESLTGILLFPSGVMGHFDCGLRTYRRHTYELRGTKGALIIPEGFVMSPDQETHIEWWHDETRETITIPPQDHYQLMVEDFADALLNHRAPKFHPQDAVSNMQAIDLLRASFMAG